MNLNELKDNELMERIANYDSRALEVLYNRYSPILFTLIKKIVGDEKLAEEILCDVFVIIWRKIHFYDPKIGNPFLWLISLARNKAVDTLKRNRDESKLEPYDDDYEDLFILPRISSQIDEMDLDTATSVKSNIENAMANLTDAQQYVLYLAYYEGLTESEIANKLKIPLQTVKSKIYVALTNLKDNLMKGVE
ncbi:MAG: sigma-70 family RNA polymerase sigma factor [Ignavibacterium sp.]